MGNEDELRFCDREYDRVQDGIYKALCFDVNVSPPWRGSQKLFLWFQLRHPWNDKQLFMSCDLPMNGQINRGHKYYRIWCEVFGKYPSRNALMSVRNLKGKCIGKIFELTTRTVTRNSKHEIIPEEYRYSVVDSLKLTKKPDNDDDLIR